MTIQDFITSPSVTHTLAAAGGALGGWLLSLIKHWPAPKKRNIYIGAFFDATQDTVKNNERVGQRRDAPEPGAAEPANQEIQK